MLFTAPPCFGGLPVYRKLALEFRRRLSRELGWLTQRLYQYDAMKVHVMQAKKKKNQSWNLP
jgi:hypothetical protein